MSGQTPAERNLYLVSRQSALAYNHAIIHYVLNSYSVLIVARSDSFHALTCLSICVLQKVSAPRSVGFFACPDLSLDLRSPGSECPSLGQILSVS
jgi:hypothetical protein